MSKSKLETAVADIEKQFVDLNKRREKTINEKAIEFLLSEISNLKDTRYSVNEKHQYRVNELNRMELNLHFSVQIINGENGFLSCPQGYDFIKSGFTCFPEILNTICMPCVEVSTRELTITHPGYKLYAIDERGMMTLINSIVDSSD